MQYSFIIWSLVIWHCQFYWFSHNRVSNTIRVGFTENTKYQVFSFSSLWENSFTKSAWHRHNSKQKTTQETNFIQRWKMRESWRHWATLESRMKWRWNLQALVNEDTLLRTHCCPWCFLGCANWETFVADKICFWTKSETFFCVPDTKFVSATNVARAGKRGNICVGNNVSATMCPRLPGPYTLLQKLDVYLSLHSSRLLISDSLFHCSAQYKQVKHTPQKYIN